MNYIPIHVRFAMDAYKAIHSQKTKSQDWFPAIRTIFSFIAFSKVFAHLSIDFYCCQTKPFFLAEFSDHKFIHIVNVSLYLFIFGMKNYDWNKSNCSRNLDTLIFYIDFTKTVRISFSADTKWKEFLCVHHLYRLPIGRKPSIAILGCTFSIGLENKTRTTHKMSDGLQ